MHFPLNGIFNLQWVNEGVTPSRRKICGSPFLSQSLRLVAWSCRRRNLRGAGPSLPSLFWPRSLVSLQVGAPRVGGPVCVATPHKQQEWGALGRGSAC